MLEINDYLEAAKRRLELKSDRQLTQALGHTHNARINYWRQGSVPEPDEMLHLAEMAGLDVVQALIDRARWDAEQKEQPRAVAVWSEISRKLAATGALALLLATGLGGNPQAQGQTVNRVTGPVGSLYIMGNYGYRRCTKLFGLIRQWFTIVFYGLPRVTLVQPGAAA